MRHQASNNRSNDKFGYSGEEFNVFVGGICPHDQPADVRDYLSRFAVVVDFSMPADIKAGGWKGYAKARLEPTSSLSAVLAKHSHWVNGHQVVVKPWVSSQEYLKNKDFENLRKVFVKFSHFISKAKLIQHFSQFGDIEKLDCRVDAATGEPRKIAYIVFRTEEAARLAAQHGSVQHSFPKIWCQLTTPKHLMEYERKVRGKRQAEFDSEKSGTDLQRVKQSRKKSKVSIEKQRSHTRISKRHQSST